MNPITKVSGVLAVVAMFSAGGAFAAESKCGTAPAPMDLPADGSALPSKEMDAVAKSFDDYQAKFTTYNKCAVDEFNAVQQKFETVIDAYAAKNSKKK